jgi:hypothetical protein
MRLLFLIVALFMGSNPNPHITPGAIDPSITQKNIHSTICLRGYTSTVRPPSSYTTSLKIRQLQAGYAVNGDYRTSDYEEDHLISLELGGSPSDPRNLWPEPYSDVAGARVKDRIENKLHDLVCSGAIQLRTAQRLIASNWKGAYRTYIGPLPTTISSSSNSGGTSHTKVGIDPRFATCKLANQNGYGPYYRGSNPEYYWYHDRNSDGKVC